MHHKSVWAFYLAGALLTLALKFYRYYRFGVKNGKSFRVSLCEWLFEASAENAFSWMTTIGIVWAVGVTYIDQVDFLWSGYLKAIPVHTSFAFLLGSLMEIAAPNAVKWLLGKMPGGGG